MKRTRARIRAAVTLVIGAALLLLLAAPAGAAMDVAGWTFRDFNSLQIPPSFHYAFDEHRIAWAKGDGVQSDVYLLDFTSGAIRQLTSTPDSEQPVTLEGDRVVWIARTNSGPLTSSELQLYDIGTGETRTVASGLIEPEAGVGMVGDHVAWLQYDAAPAGQAPPSHALYVYTISSGTTVRVTDAFTPYWGGEGMQPFSLGARYLAFVKTVGSPDQDDEVWLYDLVEGMSARLGTTVANSRSVSLRGDVLTWATRGAAGQNDGYEPADVIVYRISTGTTRTLATIQVPGPYPKTDGRFVVWDTYQGDLREIQAYDLDTDRLIDVSHNLFLNFTPEIGDGIVVWARGGELDSEIMAHDLLSGETTQLSDNRVYMDQLSQASGRTVVWWMYWWADTPGVDRFMVASAPLSAEEPFQDVEGTYRYRTAILGLYERSISGGYLVGSDRFFRPEAPLLRAQFAKMVCEALHVPVTEDMDAPFTDLGQDDPESLYPHEYVAALSALGILKGVGAGRFDPYAPLTRAQAVSILTRALDALYPGLLADVAEQPPGAYYWEPPHLANLQKAYANDLLGSLVDYRQQWDARSDCTRGEAAQLVWNALSIIEQEGR